MIEKRHKEFLALLDSIEVSDIRKSKVQFYRGIEKACDIVKRTGARGGRLFFIGNGGSAAIASHMSVDFWKNTRIPAMAFNDGSLLTCISNDFGYEHVFERPLGIFAGKKDVLFAISSSGKSLNILKAVAVARRKGTGVITLSGFKANNKLRSGGLLNFYVPSEEYGYVEVIHQYICHFVLDLLVLSKRVK